MNSEFILSLLLAYKYWIFFPLALLEGPILALAAGFLISVGFFNPIPVFLLLFLSDAIRDTLYYYMGHFGKGMKFITRNAHRVGFTDARIIAVEKLWHRHTFKAVVLSKWALGLSTPLLAFAGFSKVPVKKYFLYCIVVAGANYAFLLTLGYEFGQSYTILIRYVEYGGLIVAAGVALFIAAYMFVLHIARESVLGTEK